MHFMIFKAIAAINNDSSSICDCFLIMVLQAPLLCSYFRYDFYRCATPFGVSSCQRLRSSVYSHYYLSENLCA